MEKLITDIDWDYDMDTVVDVCMCMEVEDLAEKLDIQKNQIKKMNDTELEDLIIWKVRHCPSLGDEILNLPITVTLPDSWGEDDMDDEAITLYLEDTYGTFVRNFSF